MRQDQSIDTYVGRIGGPEGDTIYFDQGFLSFGSLDNIKQNDQTLYFQRLTVNGISAILYKEARMDDTGAVRLSIYLDAGDQQRLNHLYVFDPKNEPLIPTNLPHPPFPLNYMANCFLPTIRMVLLLSAGTTAPA